jgi:molecular chaperone GrpE (heat shock protein)
LILIFWKIIAIPAKIWQNAAAFTNLYKMTDDKQQADNIAEKNIDNPFLSRIEELESELLSATEKLELAENQKSRALADLANFQRRETENRGKWSEMAISDFLKKSLPSFLELYLGLEHSEDENFHQVVNKFFENLAKNGLEKISPAAGDSIDPYLHEVLMIAEGEPGKVVKVLEPGWKFNSTVIQPAKISGASE